MYKILLGNSSMTQAVFGSGLALMACRFLLVVMKVGNRTISTSKVGAWGFYNHGRQVFLDGVTNSAGVRFQL